MQAKKLTKGRKVAEEVSKKMRANSSVNTKPEVQLRKSLWSAGLRGYRKNYSKLPGKPDIFYSSNKLVIFINGCFWHRCPKCKLHIPKTNRKFWINKFNANKERDRRNYRNLKNTGFKVLVVWECELKKNLDSIIAKIKEHKLNYAEE